MSFFEKIIYDNEYEKDNDDIILIGGISYTEKPSVFNVFRKKPKVVRIVFKEKGDKK